MAARGRTALTYGAYRWSPGYRLTPTPSFDAVELGRRDDLTHAPFGLSSYWFSGDDKIGNISEDRQAPQFVFTGTGMLLHRGITSK